MRIALLLIASVCSFGQSKFPTTVATSQDLLVAKRLSQSTLSASITNSTLTVPVADGTQFIANELIRIDSEEMIICSISVNTLTLCSGSRGWDGSTAAAHSNGAAVRGVISATHHNQAVLEIAAIEGRLRELHAYCRSTTGNDTYTCSTTPPLAAYVTGRCLVLNPDTANTTGATIQVTSLTAVSILTRAGATLATGDITANQPITICYNGAAFIVQGDGGSGGGGGGDASTNTSSSVDGEGVLFSGTGGKTLKRATFTGLVYYTSGVPAAITGTATDCVRVNGTTGACSGSGGDASTNTSSSVDGEAVLFSGTGGKTVRRSTLTGVMKSTSGVLAAVTGSASDYVKVDGTSGPGGGGGGADIICQPSSASSTVYTCSPSPAVGSYSAGMVISFIPDVTNGLSPSLNVSGLGNRALYKPDYGANVALRGGEVIAGRPYLLEYDGTAAWTVIGITIPILTTTMGGTSTVYTGAAAPSLSGYEDQRNYVIKIGAGLTSGSNPTLNIDSQGARKIYRRNGTTAVVQIGVGELIAGQTYVLTYNSSLDSGTGGFETNIGEGKVEGGDGITVTHTAGDVLIEADSTVARHGGTNPFTGENDFSAATSIRLKTGAGAPTAGDCDAAGEAGRVYVRNNAGAANASLYVCVNTTGATFAWELQAGGGGGSTLQPVYYSVLGRGYDGSLAVPGYRATFPASGGPTGTIALVERFLAGFPNTGTPIFYVDLGIVPSGLSSVNADFHAVQQDGGVGSTVARITFAIGCSGDGDSSTITFNTASAVEVVPAAANTWERWNVTAIDITGCTAGKNMRAAISRVNSGLTGTNYANPVYGGWGSFTLQ